MGVLIILFSFFFLFFLTTVLLWVKNWGTVISIVLVGWGRIGYDTIGWDGTTEQIAMITIYGLR